MNHNIVFLFTAAHVILQLQYADGLCFGTKIVQGSSCLHNLDTGSPFSFSHGYFAHLVHTSQAVHLTKRHIRFILHYQTLVSPLEKGWIAVPCHPAGHQHGSLCSIPSENTTDSKSVNDQEKGTVKALEADVFLNITSNSSLSNATYLVGYILSKEYSQVLPCARTSGYIPSITSNGSILPTLYNDFLEKEVPEDKQMCRDSESFSPRQIVPAPQGHMYDITQCDLHDSSLSMVYVKREASMYLSASMEVTGAAYWLCGLCIIVLMACLSQEIVSLLNAGQNKARGDVCFVACLAALVLSLSTGVSHLQIFLTVEETIAFWWMVIYSMMRMVWIMVQVLGCTPECWSSSTWKPMHAAVMHQTYYNLLVTSMMLLASRIHMTVDTPYTIGLSLILGVRMFLKIYEGYGFDEVAHLDLGSGNSGKKNALSSASPQVEVSRMGLLFRQVVVLGDAVLMMVMLQAGGITQFESVVDAQACVIVLVFACICIARGVFEYNGRLHFTA